MRATLLKTQRQKSKYGRYFYYAFFRGEDGKSYRSCLYEGCHNFKRWRPFIGRENVELDGLNIRAKRGVIDADSYPKEIKNGRRPDDQEKDQL